MEVSRPVVVRRAASADLVSSGVGRILLLIAGFATGVAVARFYGADGRGEIALVTAIYANVGAVATLGLEVSAVHFLGRSPTSADAVASTLSRLAFYLSAVASIGSVLFVLILREKLDSAPVVVTLVAVIAAAAIVVSTIFQGFLVGTGRLVEVAWINAARAPLMLAGVVTAGVVGLSPAVVLAVYCASEILVLLVTATVWVRSTGAVRGRWSAPLARQMMRYGALGHLGTVVQAINYRLDIILLGALSTVTAVGQYSVAVVVAELVWLVPLIMKNFVSQRIAAGSADVRRRVATVAMKTSVATSLLFAVAVAGSASIVVPAVFGAEFGVSVDLIWILIPGVCALAIYQTMMNDLMGRGHPGIKSVTAFVACVVTISLDLVLIPSHGARGAAIASTCAYAVALMAAAPYYRRVSETSFRSWVPTGTDVVELWGAVRTKVRK